MYFIGTVAKSSPPPPWLDGALYSALTSMPWPSMPLAERVMRIFPPPDSSVDVDWFQASLNLSDNAMVSADGHTYEHRRRGGQSWRVGRSADREPIVLRVYVLRDRKPHRERLILSMPLPLPLPLPRMALGTNPFVICRRCTPTKQAAPAGLRP